MEEHTLSKFKRWVLKKIFSSYLRQGVNHNEHHTDIYGIIREEHRKIFNEDNEPTADAFLRECFEKSQYSPVVMDEILFKPNKL